MSYSLEFRPSARKAVDRLPDDIFRRVNPKIDASAAEPRRDIV
jgi:mRNA-degrading endonuclease RelE of RelBE toxin-antitoxin system